MPRACSILTDFQFKLGVGFLPLLLTTAISLLQVSTVQANDACAEVGQDFLNLTIIQSANCTGDQSSGVRYDGAYLAPSNDTPIFLGLPVLTVGALTTDINPASGNAGVMLYSGSQAGEGGGILYDDGENGSSAFFTSLTYTGGSRSINTNGELAHGLAVINTGGKGGDGYNTGPIPSIDDSDAGDGGNGGFTNVTAISGDITTDGRYASGIYALSAGGKGGEGSGSIIGEGGNSGSGGAGGFVTVDVQQARRIWTKGTQSPGIYAVSIGGSSGDAGDCIGLCVGEPDVGVAQGGGAVLVTTGMIGNIPTRIDTSGYASHGIFAQSRGGDGGDGGGGSFFGVVTFGSDGGRGGDGGSVIVDTQGQISTMQDNSRGIYAQSIGGGGGDGGGALSLGASWGGNGGVAANGGVVDVRNGLQGDGQIWTYGENAMGIYAQSVGGGGGDGGYAASGFLAIGGDGGAGGQGGSVNVSNDGIITTGAGGDGSGYKSNAIFAQSVGKGGGNGGFGVAVGLPLSLGGNGAGAGGGGAVTVNNTSSLLSTDGFDAAAIYAQSVGAGGGRGGLGVGVSFSPFSLTIGGNGGQGGSGGKVSVTSGSGEIRTSQSKSAGIFAESIGGGGGDAGGSIGVNLSVTGGFTLALGGNGDGAGNGGVVEVVSNSKITTSGDGFSPGISALSTGGRGGSGGFSFAGGIGPANLNVSLGGRGDSGGDGGAVTVGENGMLNTGDIETGGVFSPGISALSQGGGGGSAGYSVAASISGASANFTMGGNGGRGGTGGEVNVFSNRNIYTSAADSHGILAASGGGGGGVGGFSVSGAASYAQLGISLGGQGGYGGTGGNVNVGTDVTNAISGEITTYGARSSGIKAVSIGGDGGTAGFSVAAGVTLKGGMNFGIGGSGGDSNRSGNIEVVSDATIRTHNVDAHGIYAQSLAGNGGTGGFSVAGGLSFSELAPELAVSVGGGGGNAGDAGQVVVGNFGDITTKFGNGIQAESIGGNGGDAGFTAGGAFSWGDGSPKLTVTVGRGGGSGSIGDEVSVVNAGVIRTGGDGGGGGAGISAQSIGGNGGNGGSTFSGSFARGTSIQGTVNVGGTGGSGNRGGEVNVSNFEDIITRGDNAPGIYAESVGGGGGTGGSSLSALVQVSGAANDYAANLTTTVGGGGGNGSNGGAVTVSNTSFLGLSDLPRIETTGQGSHGIYAQSLGGGGGNAGNANSLSLNWDAECGFLLCEGSENTPDNFTLEVTVGGKGGGASNGRKVSITNDGVIETLISGSNGILAQSIGGGGGNGGNGSSGTGITVLDTILAAGDVGISQVDYLKDWKFFVGGDAGSSGNGGEVEVINNGDITTHGNTSFLELGSVIQGERQGSFGILAQSIGGGGGVVIADSPFAAPGETGRGGNATPGFTGKVAIGGAGAAAGDGGEVKVVNAGTITTMGSGAHAVVAQSVGGGGGVAGDVNRLPLNKEIGFNFGLNATFGRSGGGGGNGGDIEVDNSSSIFTKNENAFGILAQSVGGGGGLAGDSGSLALFSGSTGGKGDSGDILVTQSGNIRSDKSHGIVAQSVSGVAGTQTIREWVEDGGLGFFRNAFREYFGRSGSVDVIIDGDVTAPGVNSVGILAQSAGTGSSGDITIRIDSGTVTGGTGTGSAVAFLDGRNNSLVNNSNVGSGEGIAIRGGDGGERIDNNGGVTGSVELGGGSNRFNNTASGTFNSMASVNLGDGALLNNAGILSPGSDGETKTTRLTGNLNQDDTGTYKVDLLHARLRHDRLQVSGTATLAGTTEISLVNGMTTAVQSGRTHLLPILSAAGGVSGEFDTVILPDAPGSILSYAMSYSNDSANLVITAKSYNSFAGNAVQKGQASYTDSIDPDMVSDDLLFMLTELQALADPRSVSQALGSLSPEVYAASSTAGFLTASAQGRQLSNRMSALRSAANSRSSAASGEPIVLAANGDNTLLSMVLEDGRTEENQHGVWMQSARTEGDQDESGGYSGFDFDTHGFVLGYDRKFNSKATLGVALGTGGSEIDSDNSPANADVDSDFISLYGSWSDDGQYLQGSLSFGRNSIDQKRTVVVGNIERLVDGDRDSDVISLSAETGLLTNTSPSWDTGPYGALHYARIHEEGFTENGGGGFSLEVDSRSVDSLVSELGIRGFHRTDWSGNDIVTELKLAWSHDFDIDDQVLNASYTGAPGTSLRLDGPDIEKDGLILGAAVNYSDPHGMTLSLRYQGEARSDYQANTVFAEFRFNF